MSRLHELLKHTFTVRDLMWATALVSVLVAWSLDRGAISLNRQYFSFWRAAQGEYESIERELEVARQKLSGRQTALAERLNPVLKRLRSMPPEQRRSFLEKLTDSIDVQVITNSNSNKTTEDLLVFRNAIWMLAQVFRDSDNIETGQ